MQEPISVTTQYIWIAIYDDESVLPEYEHDSDGKVVQHYFADINLPHCVALILRPTIPGRSDISVKIDHKSGMRPIFFRRTPTELNFTEGTQTPQSPIHVLGWQRTISKRNVASYLYIFADGSMMLSDNKNAQ